MEEKKDILKYLNRDTSKEDLVRLKKLKDFDTIEKVAYYSSQIEAPKVNVNKALQEFNKKKENANKKGKIVAFNFNKIYKYAAAVAILFSVSYFFFFTKNGNYSTQYAETKTFNLPDNSEVILNANSQVSFSNKDWKKERNLTLNGEAYFKVEKGKKFSVNTAIGEVTVLGTQFNVKERKNYFEVKTYEGLVSVAYKDTLVKLSKGSMFKVINGKIDSLNTFNVNDNSWLQKESNFKSTPLQFVLDDLRNQYNYTINTKNVNLDQLYTGGFSHNNIVLALQAITIPLNLSYKIEGKKITIFE